MAFPAQEAAATPLPPNCTGTTSITCLVNTAADGIAPVPAGSLREAIQVLNSGNYVDDIFVPNCTGADKINFSGAFTISVASPLPEIQCGGLTINGGSVVAIDGSLTPGSTGFDVSFMPSNGKRVTIRNIEVRNFTYGTGIEGNVNVTRSKIHGNDHGLRLHQGATVDQSEVFASCTGIYTSYGGTDITGNSIHNNSCAGIYVQSTSGVHIAGNRIGLDLSSNPAGNTNKGIYIQNSPADIDGNFISANGTGIYLDSAFDISIHNNKIGTDTAGNVAMGNSIGIYAGSFSYGLEIFNNTISGNSDTGVGLSEAGGVSIHNNVIGTNTAGTSALPNNDGISAFCGSDFDFSNNPLSGNTSTGIALAAISYGGTLQVTGNRVGVAGDGVTALGNNAYGIMLLPGGCAYGGAILAAPAKTARAKAVRAKIMSPKVAVQSSVMNFTFSGNTIANNGRAGIGIFDGGNNVITGNTIRNNVKEGVYLLVGNGNSILQNAIYDNGLKNIDLAFPGAPRPNDGGDPDAGPNNGQNYPSVGPIIRGPGVTTVNFMLDSGLGSYRIDIHTNSAAVPGGKVWEGSTFVSSGVAGSFAVAKTNVDNFSLTATSASNDTSEFSPVAFVQTTPDVSITPTGVDFGNVAIGGRSPDRTISINSTGTAPYVIDSLSGDGACYGGAICYGGPFICNTNCVPGSPMPRPNSCTITAGFAPGSLGTYSTTIHICDNTATSTRNIVLTGNAVVPPPVLIDPSSFDFGNTLVGHRSAIKTFRVTNPGATAVPIGRVVTSGDFLLDSTTCPASLAPGTGCDANVLFGPLQRGPADGTLEVQAGSPPIEEPIGSGSDGMSGSVRVASGATARLSGLGTTEADAVLPTALDLGAQTRGQPALSRTITLQSRGNQSLEVSQISTSAPFAATSNCPALLPPGNDCTITVTYTSNVLGTFTGRLTVVTNSASGSGAVQLTGRTVEIDSPILRLSANSMGFGGRLLGTQSPTQRVTVENVGNVAATFASVVTSNLDFLVSGTTCTGSLLPASSCVVDVAMRPVGFGPRTGQLLVTSNAIGSPHSVSLAGSGCRPFTGASARNGSRDNCAP